MSKEDKESRIQKGLEMLGLEAPKKDGNTEDDIIKKRRALYANIKQGLAEN